MALVMPATIRPSMVVSNGENVPISSGVVLILTPLIEAGEEREWRENGRLLGFAKDPDRCIGFDLLLREHRSHVPDGLFEVWSSACDFGTYEFIHWGFPDVTWEPCPGRWGGMVGRTRGVGGGFAGVTQLGYRPVGKYIR